MPESSVAVTRMALSVLFGGYSFTENCGLGVILLLMWPENVRLSWTLARHRGRVARK